MNEALLARRGLVSAGRGCAGLVELWVARGGLVSAGRGCPGLGCSRPRGFQPDVSPAPAVSSAGCEQAARSRGKPWLRCEENASAARAAPQTKKLKRIQLNKKLKRPWGGSWRRPFAKAEMLVFVKMPKICYIVKKNH